jgi:radical SAM-linked protein
MLRNSIDGRKPEAAWTRTRPEVRPPPPPAQKLWFRVGRTGSARFLSHLETNTAWLRSLRRARAPLAYSLGFHPMPRVAYSSALPTGEESLGEYMEVMLLERVEPAELLQRLTAVLPDGFQAIAVEEVALNAPSLMSLARGARYRLRFPQVEASLGEKVSAIQRAEALVVARRGKQTVGRRVEKVLRDVDIRPMIHAIELVDAQTVDLVVVDVDGKPGKPREIIPMLTEDPDVVRVVKVDTLRSDAGGLRSFSDGWRLVAPVA